MLFRSYRLVYTPPATATSGVWTDHWHATVEGLAIEATLQFVVLSVTASISVGGAELGDAPAVTYTQPEIDGINILLQQLKCRVKNSGKAAVLDAYGNQTLEDCPIFSDEELICFLKGSLSEFNQTPHFTGFGFDSEVIYSLNAHVVVEGAMIIALAAQALVEAGREYTVSDNGITMQPPPLSSTLKEEFSALLTAHAERLKFIKCNMKPSPLGVGTFRVLAISPALMRLRHLRQRQII